ncbi:hypothetical protein BJ912DRAFT_929496 [Pholiota molesta]|nr:hypothetical protein BJ912DRAFT_929496 [Pholiota molesta]
MSVQTQQIHRRKSSREDDKSTLIAPPPSVEIPVPAERDLPSVTIAAPPARTRTQSTPQAPFGHGRTMPSTIGNPPSAGPYRTTFAPSRPLNGQALASPLRSSFAPHSMALNGHARTRSTSTPFSPVSPSPLSASFPAVVHANGMAPPPPALATSHSASEALDGPTAPKHARRHSRMHSRNLSVFFPRPGSLPHTAISEDGAQEVELVADEEAPLRQHPGTAPARRRRPRPADAPRAGLHLWPAPAVVGPADARADDGHPLRERVGVVVLGSKRGHHHKHSLSHNFFSFLEPAASTQEDLHTQPTPTPMSPWGPISAIPPDSAMATSQSTGFKLPKIPAPQRHEERAEISTSGLAASVSQFVLGGYLWVVGQQVGSLSVTGLGYWVVFDAFGVALSRVVPGWLASGSKGNVSDKERERIRRPYGTGRIETVFMFAQAVYLMFSSVYVCKETVEHLLLSAGGGEGHHHHHGDEEVGFGIDFPIFITFITFISLIGTAFFFENNTKILNITGNRIPSIPTLLRSVWSPSRHTHESLPTNSVALILSNPFVASPLFVCLSILFVALFMNPEQHRMADLVLAMTIAGLTFKVAPPRPRPREREKGGVPARHARGRAPPARPAPPRAAHLAAHPELRVLAPHPPTPQPLLPLLHASSPTADKPPAPPPAEQLVVTLELHVREDLGDDAVLQLTRWAWERCVGALGSVRDFREVGEEGGPEVTVGVVRG